MYHIETAENIEIGNQVHAIADLAETARGVQTVGETPFVLLPEGYRVENMEPLLPQPNRKRGHTKAQDLDTFLALYRLHKTEATHLYADRQQGRFRAVFNGHTAEAAGWGDHTVDYTCPFSREWEVWQRDDLVKMSQTEFAQFIERNLPDIVNPTGAEMLEISRTLQAKRNATFSSGVNLHNGATQFRYEEDIKGTTLGGTIEIPEQFTLGVRVFLNGDAYRMDARLRYRINKENQLEMWYELVRPKDIYEDAFNSVAAAIREQTGSDIYNIHL